MTENKICPILNELCIVEKCAFWMNPKVAEGAFEGMVLPEIVPMCAIAVLAGDVMTKRFSLDLERINQPPK